MKAILLIDHGSTRKEANDMLDEMRELVRDIVDDAAVVHVAHMELAQPDISSGFAACVRDGATEVIVFPYMLSPGKHSTFDIPRMVGEVASNHPGVSFSVTPPFGVERELAAVIARRAGISTGANDAAGAKSR
jgi:sirohydrochlorin ferrochelatase